MLVALGIRNGFEASPNLTRACEEHAAKTVSKPSRVAMSAALSLVLDAHPHPHRTLLHHNTAQLKDETVDRNLKTKISQCSTHPAPRRSVAEQCAKFLCGAERCPEGCTGMATSGDQRVRTRWRGQCIGRCLYRLYIMYYLE